MMRRMTTMRMATKILALALLAACRQGPPGSRVDGVAVEPVDGESLPDIFEIRRDG